MPKILVSRKISDLAEEKLKKEFDVTLNLKDQPIPCLLYTSDAADE